MAGHIASLWYYHSGLGGWTQLIPSNPPQLPAGTSVRLAVSWVNDSGYRAIGHIDLKITRPDGTIMVPTATTGQDAEVAPRESMGVQFGPILSDQAGEWRAFITLSMEGEKVRVVVECVAPYSQYLPGLIVPVTVTITNVSGVQAQLHTIILSLIEHYGGQLRSSATISMGQLLAPGQSYSLTVDMDTSNCLPAIYDLQAEIFDPSGLQIGGILYPYFLGIISTEPGP